MKTERLAEQLTMVIVVMMVFLILNSCSKKSTQSTTSSDADGFQVTSSSAGAHTHSVKILFTDLTNPPAAGVTYTSSSAGHTHTIFLSQQQLTAINSGSTITVVSSVYSGHSHDFVITKP